MVTDRSNQPFENVERDQLRNSGKSDIQLSDIGSTGGSNPLSHMLPTDTTDSPSNKKTPTHTDDNNKPTKESPLDGPSTSGTQR